MANRYTCYDSGGGVCLDVQKADDGYWVKYDDYKRLEDALRAIVAAKNEPHYGYIDVAWDHLWTAVDKHEHLVA